MFSHGYSNDPIARSENLTIQEVVTLLGSRKAQNVHVERWICEACGLVHTTIAPIQCEEVHGSAHSELRLTEVPLD